MTGLRIYDYLLSQCMDDPAIILITVTSTLDIFISSINALKAIPSHYSQHPPPDSSRAYSPHTSHSYPHTTHHHSSSPARSPPSQSHPPTSPTDSPPRAPATRDTAPARAAAATPTAPSAHPRTQSLDPGKKDPRNPQQRLACRSRLSRIWRA